MKVCARCRHLVPLDQFRYDGRTRDRLTYRCVACLDVTRRVNRPMP